MPNSTINEGAIVRVTDPATFSFAGAWFSGGNALGDWFCVSSNTMQSNGFMVIGHGDSGSLSSLIDFGIGTSGSVVAIVQDILLNAPGSAVDYVAPYLVPINIPSGAQLFARGRNSSASSAGVRFQIQQISHLYRGGLSQAITYGVVPTSSAGTLVDPGTTVNTWGAWVTVASATINAIRHMLISFSQRGNTTLLSTNMLSQFAVGPVGQEKLLFGTLNLRLRSNDNSFKPNMFNIPLNVPAGTRVACRAQATTADANDRLFWTSFVGFN